MVVCWSPTWTVLRLHPLGDGSCMFKATGWIVEQPSPRAAALGLKLEEQAGMGNAAETPSSYSPSSDSSTPSSSNALHRRYSKPLPTGTGVPVYVMLPLDTVDMLQIASGRWALNASLAALKSVGVEGMMVDVWWGLVEKQAPGEYDWSGYAELFHLLHLSGLKIQAVMSFHQCGSNVGDSCCIPLPDWVVDEIDKNPDLVYTDKSSSRNYECISLACDVLPVLRGRSPIQAYADYMTSFRDYFKDLVGDVIVEIQVGMGPAGELRYPSYPQFAGSGQWRFPGIGEFQCFDKYMLASLEARAASVGKGEWGLGGPPGVGSYNHSPEDTHFFKDDGIWSSPYGQFFLEWYADALVAHGDRLLSAAHRVFQHTGAGISGKVSGIHWRYGTRSHAAELTAGYYNTDTRDGYRPLASMFAKYGAALTFTCMEMKDAEQPADAESRPEALVAQVAAASQEAGIAMSGENALSRFDDQGFHQIVKQSKLQFVKHGGRRHRLHAFTYLRLCHDLFVPENWNAFASFVRRMRDETDFEVSDDRQQSGSI